VGIEVNTAVIKGGQDLLDCNSMSFGSPFQRNVSPPSSGWNSKPRKEPERSKGQQGYNSGYFDTRSPTFRRNVSSPSFVVEKEG
jgi:hypothetical protein